MAETYDIAPFDLTVKQDEELFDSAKETDPQNEFPIGEPTAGFTPSPTPVGLSAQQSFPAPIPPPDPFPFIDEPSAPSEAELRDAWVKLQPNGGLDPEMATKYGDVLRRGSEAKKNEDLAKRKEDIKGQYRTPDGVLQMAKDPTVRREMDASPDDDLVIKRALNRSYLASTYNKPNASPEELDQIMRAHSITHWGINNPSHDTFYSRTRDDVLKSDEDTKVWRSMSTTVAQKILEDQLAGKQTSFSETFEKFATANPKVITAQNKDEWYMTGLLMDERLRKLGESVRFPASQLIDIAGKVTDGTATELDWDRATNAFRGVNPTDLEQVLKVASIAVREQDPKGEMIKTIAGNIGKRFDRDFNLSKVYEQDRELLLNDQLKNLEAGMTIGKDKNGRLVFAQPGQPLPEFAVQLDQAEYNQYWNDAHRAMDGMAIARVIQQFQEQVADPVVPYFKGGLLGAAEAGAYDIAGFSKLIPLGLIPGPAGLLSMAKVVSASTYHDIRLENPNLPIEAARDWANVDGVFNSVGMKFKTDFLLGRYPFFTSVRQLKGAGRSIEAVMVYGRWAAVHNLEENFEELAQDTLSASLAKLYGDAYPDSVKQQTWGDMLVDIARTRPQVAMAVGPLSLIGAGHATVRDLRNPMRDFMNPDALKSVGLSDEKVAEVLASKDLDEAQKIFQKHYNTLTKEDLKRGFEYAAGLTEKDEVDAAMADPAMPTIDPVVMPDGTYKYNVLAPDGTVLSTHTDPDVAETAWVRETERVKGEHWAAEKNAAAQQAAAEAAARASDEGVAGEAEAKATAETVSPEDRLGTAMTVEFEENAAPTPEESREVSQLQADVAAQGRADVIVLARPSNAQAGPGQASLNFIRAFERATGKRVVFVASGNDQPLSFTGAVRKGDPNTIFLDAHGDRNVLALVGHEWSHTLEHTSPELHAEMIGRMKPLIIEWAKQEGILAKEVGPEGVTNEMVANIVGDAISNENFWTVLAQKNPSLFEKVRDAVLKFLNQFIGKVQKSEFGTEAFIKDVVQMRDIVADIMDRAGQGAEAAPAGAGVSFAPQAALTAEQRQEVQFANRRTEKGFYSKLEDFVSGPKIQKVSSPEQVKATINGAGIKAEEIKWSGVMPKIDEIAAENQGKVPKAELVNHLENEGSVKFEEVTLSMDLRKQATQEFGAIHKQILEERGLRLIVGEYASDIHLLNADRRIVPVPPDLQPQVDRAFELFKIVNQEENVPRYEQYVLPGGENYREVVLAMPERDKASARLADLQSKAASGRITPEETNEFRRLKQAGKEPAQRYTSSHFPNVPNYVAHMRLNEREGGLFIEEIQSDRHQAGREKGYVEPEVRKRQQELLGKETLTDAEVAEIEALSKTKPGEIPDAPFRSDWHIAMFKRALRDAVALGQNWIGWTTGGTQYDRWGSEKFDWERLPDDTTVPHKFGTPEEQAAAHRRLKEATDAVVNTSPVSPEYSRVTEEHTRAQQAMTDLVPGWGRPEHHVRSWRLSAQEQFQGEAGGVNMEEEARQRGLLLEEKGTRVVSFEDVLGVVSRVSRDKDKAKGMAEKLWKKMQEKDSGTSLPRKEGMEYFYDTALPSAVGKYVKQWGGKVEQETLGQEQEEWVVHSEGGIFKTFPTKTALDEWENALEEGLEDPPPDPDWYSTATGKYSETTPIWKVEITPQMKAGVTEGQVMFAPRREAARVGQGKRTVAGFAFAGRRGAAVEAETAARMAEPEGRVAFFQKIRDRVQSLIKEHDTRREGRLPPEKIDPANELARLDNAVRAKMEGIDRREQAALDKITLRVLSQFNAPADTGVKLQDLENQRQSEIEAAERDWQKTFSRESKNLSDLTFQQRLVTFERIRGLERQYKERLRGIRNVYRERGRALLQAVATDKAAAETAIKADTRLASEVEKRFDVERREAERQHELRQKQIEQRAELRTKIGQQAFESKEARRRLIESIGEYNAMLKALPPDLRGRIGGIVEVSKITDEEQMAAFFSRQIGKIDEVLEHHLKLEYQERINDLLATYKPKKTPGGVLTTKIGDAQQVVNDIREMAKMDDAAVASEIASLETKINGGLTPEEEIAAHQRQNLLRMFGDLESQSAAALANAHQFLKATIIQGRATWGAIEEARLANQRAQGMAVRDSLGPSSPAMAAARRDKLDRWKGTAASMYNFGQFMHDIFPDLPFVQNWVDRSRDADSGIQDFMIDVDTRFSDLVRRFTGNSVIKGGAALEALNERTIAVPGGKASKMEAIQYLLSWAQADAQPRMVRDGWTDDHIETLRRETDDPLSAAISQFLRKEYDAAYNKINAVYKRMYGMDLPRITNYAPLRYEHSGLPEDVAPFGSPTSISGATPTFAHARVKHSASLKQMDALTVYMQHMQQAAHFIHYAELVREMRGTLNDGKVKEAIGSNMGPYQADTIDKWMLIIARGGTAKATEQLIMKDATAYLTKGTAIGALALNIKSAVSQLDSAFRWLYEIPPRAWLPAFLKPGWMASVPQVWHSNAIQRRIHDGMNPISQHLMATNNLTPGLLLRMTRLGMAPIRYTDAAGTTISSAIVFQYHYDQLIKSGASAEDAAEQAAVLMDRAVHKFSQPTGLTSKSIVENTQTGVAKASLLFMSDPRMKTALLMEAFGDIRRGDIETGVGKIVAGMAMGALTLLAVNLFRDWASDDDDEDIWTLAGFLNAMSFGQFHGVFIAGNVIDYIGTSGLAKLTGEKIPYYGARGDILTETYKRAERILKDPTQLWSDDPKELIKTWENALRVMGIIAPPVAALAGLANVAKTVLGVSENLEKTE